MLLRQKFIYRVDLQANPNVVYLFGDNDKRVGLGGQAKEMRGEPNAVGVRTKAAPGMGHFDFWTDQNFHDNCTKINEDMRPVFRHAKSGIVIIPLDGLGTGFSQLKERAPATLDYLECLIGRLNANRTHLWHDDEPSDYSIVTPPGVTSGS